ncbi:MAG: hypothetical protein H6672_11775 [Anaerolineaceae bacterium]|nr:hypothetical protein [Anaerolineaceae bacterium]
MPAKSSRGPWLWPLGMALVGIVLLLNNFLLVGDFNVVALWPLLLVVVGAWILLRGDLTPGEGGRTFGITRGSVESATLEVSSGEIDVQIQSLQREGRLIAGQYAAFSRPGLRVNGTHTHLMLHRGATPWLSFADWEMALAADLPWQVLLSTHLGRVNMDASGLILQEAIVATGLGDIRFICPPESFSVLFLCSALGNIHLITPVGYRTQIAASGSRLFGVHADPNRYETVAPGVFVSRDADETLPLVEVTISGTFGDAYLT